MGELASSLGQLGFGPVNAYALMIFCLLYSPCMAAVATIHREPGSWKWTIRTVLFQILVAWAGAVLVYQIGSLLFG